MKDDDTQGGINPSQYQALSNFLRGYLHQDAGVEYGSAIWAAQAFRKDADERETIIVRSELDHLLWATAKSTEAELEKTIMILGSSWRFSSRKEVEQLRDALK